MQDVSETNIFRQVNGSVIKFSHTFREQLLFTHCSGIFLLSKSSKRRYSCPSSEIKGDPWLVHKHKKDEEDSIISIYILNEPEQ